MAGYKPKNLDEINDSFIKGIDAANEIKKSESIIENASKPVQSGFLPDSSQLEENETDRVSAEISGIASEFAKKFAGEDKEPIPVRPQPVSISVQSRPRPVKGPAKAKNAAEKPSFELKDNDKPQLVRNSERSDLFENYKKIMNDEEDSSPAGDGKSPKAKKTKAETKLSSKIKSESDLYKGASNNDDVPVAEITDENAVKEEKKKPRKKEKKKAPKPPKVEKPKVKSSPKQVVLMLVLLCVLLIAAGVGSIKTVFAVNSGDIVFDRFRVYTAESDLESSPVKKGSLIVTMDRDTVPGEVFAYETDAGELRFAKHKSSIGSDALIAFDGNSESLIFKDELRGVVAKSLPVIGMLVSVISQNFTLVFITLLSIALLLVLIIFLSYRDKKEDDSGNDDNFLGAFENAEDVDEENGETVTN